MNEELNIFNSQYQSQLAFIESAMRIAGTLHEPTGQQLPSEFDTELRQLIEAIPLE